LGQVEVGNVRRKKKKKKKKRNGEVEVEVFRGIPLPDAIHSCGGVLSSSAIPADRP